MRMVLRRYLSKAEALPAKMEATAMEIFMLMVRKGQWSGEREAVNMDEIDGVRGVHDFGDDGNIYISRTEIPAPAG